MSIKFVACALAGLLLASDAFAATPVSAHVEKPLMGKSLIDVGGVVWTCEGTRCIAGAERSVSVAACRELSRKISKLAGQVTAFYNDAKMLDADALALCNARIPTPSAPGPVQCADGQAGCTTAPRTR